MMNRRYLGSRELTDFLFAMSGLEPCTLLELSTGGPAVLPDLLEQGFFAASMGPEDTVLHTSFPDGSFDAVLSEGSCSLSGDPAAARKEAARLLRPGGTLLLADASPLRAREYVAELLESGLEVLHVEEATELWQQAAAESADSKLRYYLAICEKKDGFGRRDADVKDN